MVAMNRRHAFKLGAVAVVASLFPRTAAADAESVVVELPEPVGVEPQFRLFGKTFVYQRGWDEDHWSADPIVIESGV